MNKFAELEGQINQFLSKTEIYYHGKDMLQRMKDLMDAIGNPEKTLKIIHVAGTSGKTSTCYFVASLLNAAGFTTGLTVSPHVDTVRERAIINLQPLSEAAWTQHMQEFFTIVQQSGVKPSYFEFYMAFAFWLFAKQNLDYAIIETGLGGTWDGSNVAKNPDKIDIITDIGYDHMEVLGDTLGKIATEKAGIIHEGNAVFMYSQDQEVMTAISTRKTLINFDLHIIEDVTKNFMVRNFNLAQKAVDFALKRDGKPLLTTAQIKQARTINIPARAEQIQYKGKTIIMDGSHNPQKLQAFVQYLNQKYPSSSRSIVATIGSNKLATLDDSIQILRQVSDQIILTSFKSESIETNKRTSIDEETLLAAAKNAGFKEYEYIHQPMTALERALKTPAQQIIITGSFYLLDHIRPHILFKNP